MCIHHVALEIKGGVEDDKLLSEASSMLASKMRFVEMFFLCRQSVRVLMDDLEEIPYQTVIILETASLVSRRTDASRDGHVLQVSDVVLLANKAVFVSLSHMRIQLVVAEEAFAAKLAVRMNTALDIFRSSALCSMRHGRQVHNKLIVIIQSMLMSEHFLAPDAQITVPRVIGDMLIKEGVHLPHQLVVGGTDVKAKIAPPVGDVVAGLISTIEAKQQQSVVHHLLRLEEYRQSRILVWDGLWRERRESCIRRFGQDHSRLWFLRGQWLMS